MRQTRCYPRAFLAGATLTCLLFGCGRALRQPGGARPATPVRLESMRMITARLGWALGEGAVLKTRDGGRTWRKLLSLGQIEPSSARADFLTVKLAWVAAPGPDGTTTIFRTTDGGASWRSGSVPYPGVVQIDFVSPRDGWLLVAPRGASMGSEAVLILGSRDGGSTWSTLAATPAEGAPAPGQIPLAGLKNGIGFRDTETGWTAGVQASRPGAVRFLRTDDGGRTWANQDLRVPAPFLPDFSSAAAPAFMSTRDGWLPVTFFRNDQGPGRSSVVVFTTHDGGGAWAAGAPVGPGSLAASDFIDSRRGWVALDNQGQVALYRTTDGAGSWERVAAGGVLRGLHQLSFVSAALGWALSSETGLLMTSDGGRTWRALRTVLVP